MKLFKDLMRQKELSKEKRKQELRLKNAELRRSGKEPLKGWNQMVNTGMGGLNKSGPGSIDMTGKGLGTYNYYSEEQRQVAQQAQAQAKKEE